VDDGADAALVATASEHDELRAGKGGREGQLSSPTTTTTERERETERGTHVALLKLDVVDNLVLDEVKLDDVVDLDGRVRVADRAAVVRDDEGDALCAELHLAHLEELVRRLLLRDAVDRKAALDVVQEAEVLAGLLDRDNVCTRTSEEEGGGERGRGTTPVSLCAGPTDNRERW